MSWKAKGKPLPVESRRTDDEPTAADVARAEQNWKTMDPAMKAKLKALAAENGARLGP